MTQDFDPEPILSLLDRHDVSYVLIGGLAATALGSSRITFDLDICYERTRENLDRLAAALRELGARLRGVNEDVPFVLDAKTLEMGDHFTFTTSHGSFDILGTPAGSKGYTDLVTRAHLAEMFGVTVLIVSIDDLIQMKRAAGRQKDLEHIAILEELRDQLEKTEPREQDSES